MTGTAKKQSAPEPDAPGAKTYTTKEVAKLLQITIRQLQWWDEQGLVQPVHKTHMRFYSEYNIRVLRVITMLRSKGMTLQGIKYLLPRLQRLCWLNRGRVFGVVKLDMSRWGAATHRTSISFYEDAEQAAYAAALVSGPVYLIQGR